jgi:hypothetical protein
MITAKTTSASLVPAYSRAKSSGVHQQWGCATLPGFLSVLRRRLLLYAISRMGRLLFQPSLHRHLSHAAIDLEEVDFAGSSRGCSSTVMPHNQSAMELSICLLGLGMENVRVHEEQNVDGNDDAKRHDKHVRVVGDHSQSKCMESSLLQRGSGLERR